MIQSNGWLIARVYQSEHVPNKENSLLMTAAPDLLTALEQLLADSECLTRQRCAEACESYGEGTDAEKVARAAIAKATRNA